MGMKIEPSLGNITHNRIRVATQLGKGWNDEINM